MDNFIDQEALDDYIAMRAKIKKPMTERRMRQFEKRLQELHDKGHDVNACLDAATDAQWLDVYALRDKTVPNLKNTEGARTRAYLESRPEHQERSSEATEMLKKARQAVLLKRVA